MAWAEFQTWLVPTVIGAIGFILWRKLDGLDSKVDLLIQTELRYIDVRISIVEKHLGLDRPAR